MRHIDNDHLTMTVEPFGQLKFVSSDKAWFGLVDNICPDNKVELFISADNDKQSITDKVELVRQLAADYDIIITKLHQLAFQKYKDTEFEKELSDIKQMYFLTAVSLMSDNQTWWLTLEPDFNVTSIYNHFLRFTMVDREIVWTNFDTNTNA